MRLRVCLAASTVYYPDGGGHRWVCLTWALGLTAEADLLACRYRGGRFRLPATDRFRLRRVAMGPDTDVARALGRS